MLKTLRAEFNLLSLNTQLMIILTLLNIVDFQTTAFLVGRYGFEVEANPIMYNAMVLFDSVYGLLYIKVVVLAVLWWVYNQVDHHHKLINPQRMTYLLTGLVAAFFALITWNFYLVTVSLLTSPPL